MVVVMVCNGSVHDCCTAVAFVAPGGGGEVGEC